MNPVAVEAIYRAEYAVVVGHLTHRGWPLCAAEDAVQGAFLQLLKEPDVRHPRSWLTLVAWRRARDAARTERRRREEVDEIRLLGYPDRRPSPLDRVERLDELQRAAVVLGQLRPIDREALLRWSQAGRRHAGAAPLTRNERRRLDRAHMRLKAYRAA